MWGAFSYIFRRYFIDIGETRMDDISLVWYNERISMNAIISRKQMIARNQIVSC